MNAQQLIETVKKLNLPKEQYIVVGSGPMVVRNLREGADIDIVTKPELLEKLAQQYPVRQENGVEKVDLGNDVEMVRKGIFNNSEIISLDEMFEKAELIEDVPFLNLEQLIIFKQKLGREKDFKDMELIKNYLSKREG